MRSKTNLSLEVKSMEKTGRIYILKDPIDGSIRYVGQTILSLQKRYNAHVANARKAKLPREHSARWIKKLIKARTWPVIECVEDNIPLEILCEREIYYIDYYKSMGCSLCNHHMGGKNRGYHPSDETRIILEAKRKAKLEIENNLDQKRIVSIKKSGEIDQVFNSSKDAAKYYGFNERKIRRVCLEIYGENHLENIRFIAV